MTLSETPRFMTPRVSIYDLLSTMEYRGPVNSTILLISSSELFSEKFTVKDYISNTKLEQGDHYYIQTRYKDLFSHHNLILKKLYEKMSRKALENTNEICSCPLGIL